MTKKSTEADVAAMPPLCLAGCVWFTASKRGMVVGLCHRFPAQTPISSTEHYCGEFLTLDEYKARVKSRSLGVQLVEQGVKAATK